MSSHHVLLHVATMVIFRVSPFDQEVRLLIWLYLFRCSLVDILRRLTKGLLSLRKSCCGVLILDCIYSLRAYFNLINDRLILTSSSFQILVHQIFQALCQVLMLFNTISLRIKVGSLEVWWRFTIFKLSALGQLWRKLLIPWIEWWFLVNGDYIPWSLIIAVQVFHQDLDLRHVLLWCRMRLDLWTKGHGILLTSHNLNTSIEFRNLNWFFAIFCFLKWELLIVIEAPDIKFELIWDNPNSAITTQSKVGYSLIPRQIWKPSDSIGPMELSPNSLTPNIQLPMLW